MDLVHVDGVADDDGELLDLAAEGAPPFANVRSMDIVSAWKFPACELVASSSLEIFACQC